MTVIAERTLTIDEDSGRTITVKLGSPTFDPGTGDFACPYQICGPGIGINHPAFGFDGIQAIELAIRMIGAELDRIEKTQNITLRWGDARDHGFRRP